MLEILGLLLLLSALISPLCLLIWMLGEELIGQQRSFGQILLRTAPWSLLAVLCAPLCMAALLIRRYGALRGLVRFLAGGALIAAAIVLGFWLAFMPKYHETDNPADYGVITGNYDDQRAEAFIMGFFPETIGNDFADVTYHYKAIKFDSIACEAYLSFTLPDKAAFDEHRAALIRYGEPQPFPFDGRYEMWVTGSDMYTWTRSERRADMPETDDRNIESATAGLILCDQDAQRFVYSALMVYDGGGTKTTDLNYFFTQFRIDPLAFEQMLTESMPPLSRPA